MSNKIDLAYRYYLANKVEIVSKYFHKYIAIVDDNIISSNDNKMAIIQNMLNNGYTIGDFLIQYVDNADDEIQRFYSRFVL